MKARDFRNLFGLPGALYTDIAVSAEKAIDIPAIAGKIQQEISGARTITREEILLTYDSAFSWRGGVMRLLLVGAAFAIFILSWDRASGLSAGEKKEIGILKATGWESSDVLLIRFWEGIMVSITSFFAGVLLAYVHVFIASAVLFSPVLKGWSVLYPEPVLIPFIDGYQLAMLFLVTVIPYTAATIMPSWRAATADPDAVIRG
jgi:ABC-type lipoprotein release transport system permease subunit